jgi:hypothetical protein
MIRNKLFTLLALIIFSSQANKLFADGGMHPINTIKNLPLAKAGLKISANDIFNPKGQQGLVKAIVKVGGCTGSFVSDNGLIITNHHCAFGALEPYSTTQNNLFEKGYLAQNKELELPFKGVDVKILESFEDVSAKVLSKISDSLNSIEKQKAINEEITSMKVAENILYPELYIEISEMLPGKSYMVFRYKILKDIRIVYIPARNIGEFGGESDNWMWPRHTGDFSFLRAYVGKDGKPAEYSEENVPYKPTEFLTINKDGLQENDFVFILGYPGRTYKQYPTPFLVQQEKHTLPFISNTFNNEIRLTKEVGAEYPSFLLSKQTFIKRRANTAKNFEGKLKSMRIIRLIEQRKSEDARIYEKLDSASKIEWKSINYQLDTLYNSWNQFIENYYWHQIFTDQSNSHKIINNINMYLSTKNDSIKNEIKKEIRKIYASMNVKYEEHYLKFMLIDNNRFSTYKGNKCINDKLLNKVANNYTELYKVYASVLDSNLTWTILNSKETNYYKKILDLNYCINYNKVELDDKMIAYNAMKDNLLPIYVDLRLKAEGTNFIPDANSTLRLTYGYIKGYSPADGIYAKPFTTIRGMLEKAGIKDDYVVNEGITNLYEKFPDAPFASGDQPLCLLYNLDTTGGNSGSPVLDKLGRLIALNFDRVYEATVNDYTWDDKFSRSIGLDIRFVIWTTQHIAKANHIIDEIFVEKTEIKTSKKSIKK